MRLVTRISQVWEGGTRNGRNQGSEVLRAQVHVPSKWGDGE